MNSTSQPWFDAECRAARMEYINVKNRYKRRIQLQRRLGIQVLNIDSFQREFELANKKYKGFLRHKRRKYGKDLNAFSSIIGKK